MEHNCEVLFLTEEKTGLVAALRDRFSDQFAVREVILNGQSPVGQLDHPPGPCVMVLSSHDFAKLIECVAEVRRHDVARPILLVTPEQDTDLLLRAYRAGANDCIPSTISPALLAAKVRVWQRWSCILAHNAGLAS